MKLYLRFCIWALVVCSIQTTLAQPVFYADLFDNTTFPRSIDLSKPVGAIDGAASTTLIGGAAYTIPLKCPPGTHGVLPNLTVSYNSQGGNNLLGQGWSLSGLSVITRSGKDLYHNRGAVSPVTYTNNDNFVLDGAVLYPVSPGTGGSPGANYNTEVRNYAKVTSYGTMAGGGPEKFTVTTREGSIMEYGYTADAKVLTNDNSKVMMWRLNRLQDVNGNYIDFIYDNTDRDSRIIQIKYTGNLNASLVPYNTIDFVYAVKDDKNTVYENGNTIQSKYLLTQISIRAEGELFKTYQFYFGKNEIAQSYLKSIEEFAGDGSKLNDTRFKYGDNAAAVSEVEDLSVISPDPSITSVPASGDFDGDGLADLLITNKMNEAAGVYNNGFTIKKRSATSGAYTATSSITFSGGGYTKVENSYILTNSYNYASSDFNGDGRDDIAVSNSHYDGGARLLDWIKIYCPDATGAVGSSHTYLYEPPGIYDAVGTKQNYFHIGDFNGDGYADFLTVLEGGIFFTSPAISVTNRTVTFPPADATGTLIGDADKVLVINMEGDSKNELLVVKDNITRIFKLNIDVSGTSLVQVSNNLSYPTKQQEILCGDFNGDGKTDLLTGPVRGGTDTYQWSISYSDGTSFLTSPFNFEHTIKNYQFGYGGTVTDKLIIDDFNGDGKSDILDFYSSGSTVNYSTYFSNGSQFVLKKSPCAYVPRLEGFFITGDFNGDARADLYFYSYELLYHMYGQQIFTSFNPFGQGNLLSKVTDGQNRTTGFQYQPITKGTGAGSFYTKGSGETYPVNNSQLPVYVVTNMTAPDGIGGTNTTNYAYENFRIHRAGKGVLGFGKVTSVNNNADLRSETTYGLNRTVWVPYEQTTKTFQNSTGTQLSQTDNTFTFDDLYTGIYTYGYYRQLLTGTTTQDMLAGTSAVVTNSFNAYDNLTSTTSTVSGGPETITTTVAKTFVASNIVSGIPDQPSEIITTSQRGTQPALASKATFAYSSKGNLLNTTNQSYPAPYTPLVLSEYYTYDTCGNRTSIEMRSAGGAIAASLWPKTQFYYDAKKRFIIGETNPQGHSSYTSCDKFWGKPLSVTGINGLTTSYTYDGWGKLRSTTIPSSATASYTVSYSDGWDIAANYQYYTLVTDPSAPDTKTWYDAAGRVVKTQSETFGGAWTTSLVTYNAKGNIASSTNNYLSSETPIITANTYDGLNRISTTANVFGTTNYNYTTGSGLKTTTVTAPDGKITSSTTDASGKVIRSSNGIAGVVHYKYDSRGNEITSALGTATMAYQNLTTKEYDASGNLVKMKDPDAGTITYVYNAFGQVTSQTDPAGLVTSYSYDLMGRMIQKTLDGFITDYQYYDNTKDYRLKKAKVTLPSGIFSVEDNYDYAVGSGNTYHSHKSLSTPAFEKRFTYDNYGNLSTTEYVNSGFKTRNYYDANGFLLKITTNFAGGGAGDRMLYLAESKNGNGQLTGFRRVDNLPAVINYHYGFATGYYTPGLQDLVMDYNYANGNLNSRFDNRTATREDFNYDAIDRLTHAAAQKTGPGAVMHAPLDMTYDNNFWGGYGRLTSKSDAGTYTYSGSPRNAVKSITDPVNLVSHETQDIVYAPFDKTTRITEQVGGIAYELTYLYNAAETRCYAQEKQGGTLVHNRWYMADYEVDNNVTAGTTQHIHYIYGDAGLCGIVIAQGGSFSYYGVYTDHLGSLVTVTDQTGTVVARQSYDAWGRERNPDTWGYTMGLSVKPDWLYRGYTGHEMLPQFGLINMNGRMYDPLNGRMLRPDNYIQEPGDGQSYNRYSYCFNNPIKYTDPSGEIVWFVPIIYAAVNVAVDLAMNNGKMDFGQIAMSAGMGALGGLTSGASTVAGALAGAGLSQVNRLLPSIPIYHSENFNLGISPVIGMGSSGLNFGANLNASGQMGDWSYSASVGAGYNSGLSSLGEAVGGSGYWNSGGFLGYTHNNTLYGGGYSYNSFFGGKTNQGVGAGHLQVGDFGLRLDEDFFGDGYDRYRTGGLLMTYKVNRDVTFALGGSMMTGMHGGKSTAIHGEDLGPNGTYDNCREDLYNLRGGTMYGGVIYKGQSYFYGHNSERRLHTIQNAIHRNYPIRTSPYFEDRMFRSRTFSYYGSYHPFYLNY